MKKVRRIKPGQRKKERKAATEALESKTAAFLDHPKECCVCKASFERNHETVKSWHVVIKEASVRLTCPSCWARITEAAERGRNV
jgi:hypothetical protein